MTVLIVILLFVLAFGIGIVMGMAMVYSLIKAFESGTGESDELELYGQYE